jgi:predicted RNA-binding protein
MCEANAYLIGKQGEKEVMKDIDFMDVQADYVVFRDLLGRETRVKGRLKAVDFGKHRITVQETD